MKKLESLPLGLAFGVVNFIIFLVWNIANAFVNGYIKNFKIWGSIITSVLFVAVLAFIIGSMIAFFYNIFVSKEKSE